MCNTNLLHSSGPNLSEHHRRIIIICHNALANPQIKTGHKENLGLSVTCDQVPVPPGSDEGILRAARQMAGV